MRNLDGLFLWIGTRELISVVIFHIIYLIAPIMQREGQVVQPWNQCQPEEPYD